MANMTANTDSQLREEEHLKEQADARFNVNRTAIMYGIIAGVLMSIGGLLFQPAENTPGLWSSVAKYLFFIPVLVYALVQYSKVLKRKIVFQNGIKLGMFLSAIAALTYLLVTVLLGVTGIVGTAPYMNESAEVSGNFFIAQFANALGVLVAGMIVTFITLQFTKTPDRSDS